MSELDSIFLAPPTPQNAAPAPAHPSGPHLSFGDVLSALNPLQYIPVVGTLYRAATGDTIPDGTRMAGGMVLSTLMGGPVGLVTNIATTLFEKATGFDPERVGRSVLAGLGLGSALDAPAATPADAPTAVAKAAPPTAAPTQAAPEQSASTQLATAQPAAAQLGPEPARPLLPVQLAAYGVAPQRGDAGLPKRGTAVSADQLNALELERLGATSALAAVAYNKAARQA